MPAFISWWCWCKHRHVLQVFKVAGIVQQTQQGISMRVTACQDKLQPHLPTGLCSAVLPLLSPSLCFTHCWHPMLFFCLLSHGVFWCSSSCSLIQHFSLSSSFFFLFFFFHQFSCSTISLFSYVRQTDFALDNMAPIIWKD